MGYIVHGKQLFKREELPGILEDFIIEWDGIWQKATRHNKKTITNMFYVLCRQREMGEFVTVYTSE
jgi:hypothetical protein